jgi:hypothetical protein
VETIGIWWKVNSDWALAEKLHKLFSWQPIVLILKWKTYRHLTLRLPGLPGDCGKTWKSDIFSIPHHKDNIYSLMMKCIIDISCSVEQSKNISFLPRNGKTFERSRERFWKHSLLVLCLKWVDINTHVCMYLAWPYLAHPTSWARVIGAWLCICSTYRMWTWYERESGMDTFFKMKSKVKKPKKALFCPKRELFDFLSCVHPNIKPDTSSIASVI